MKRARQSLLFMTVLAAVIATGLRAQRNRPLEIAFIGFTNVYQYDQRVAIFATTNRNTRPLRYSMQVERKTAGGWMVYSGQLTYQRSPVFTAPAGNAFTLCSIPPTGEAPWRISLAYSFEDVGSEKSSRRAGLSMAVVMDNTGTFVPNLRLRLASFFYLHNWNALGRFFDEGVRFYIAVGPEMRNKTTVLQDGTILVKPETL